MRVVFMGTPDFSVGTLTALVESGHDVVAVVTQPDKPKGRGKSLIMSEVKKKALEYNIPVYQPVKVRDEEFVKTLREINPQVIVVVAFGQILRKNILDLPEYGCINVHASLLPMYRGAAPIQWAVLDGVEETGVTIMKLDEGIDTGDMLMKTVVKLDPKETYGSLNDKLAAKGAELLIEALKVIENGTAVYTKQEGESCYARMLDKQLGRIDFTKPACEIERLIRGLNPWPSAYTYIEGKTLKIWDADVVDTDDKSVPGTIIAHDKKSFTVMTGDKALRINEVQMEGKKRMFTDAFLRGFQIEQVNKLG